MRIGAIHTFPGLALALVFVFLVPNSAMANFRLSIRIWWWIFRSAG